MTYLIALGAFAAFLALAAIALAIFVPGDIFGGD